MTDWREARDFCYRCRTWRSNIEHGDCPLGRVGSLVYIDIDDFRKGCNKCNEVWALEATRLFCQCGNVQDTQYVDAVDMVQAGQRVIATDGSLVYVMTRKGAVMVSRRSYPGSGY